MVLMFTIFSVLVVLQTLVLTEDNAKKLLNEKKMLKKPKQPKL